MDFEDRLEQMRAKVGQLAGELGTEEATKNALVMPFIKDILGYDVFNPMEVIPEFTAEPGHQKRRKGRLCGETKWFDTNTHRVQARR